MVYTEYFLKGTQPSTLCPLHGDRSFIETLAGVFGKDTSPAVPVETAGAPAPAAPGAPASNAAAKPSPAPPAGQPENTSAAPAKKRGFWSRVFGLGRDDDKRSEEEKKKEEKKKKEEQKKKPGDQ